MGFRAVYGQRSLSAQTRLGQLIIWRWSNTSLQCIYLSHSKNYQWWYVPCECYWTYCAHNFKFSVAVWHDKIWSIWTLLHQILFFLWTPTKKKILLKQLHHAPITANKLGFFFPLRFKSFIVKYLQEWKPPVTASWQEGYTFNIHSRDEGRANS